MKKLFSFFLSILFMMLFSTHAFAATGTMRVAFNGETMFAILPDGNVKGWGLNKCGEVGNGSTNNQLTPTVIPELKDAKEILCGEAGSETTFAIMLDGKVRACGSNKYGQLGINSNSNQTVPIEIPGLTGVSSIVTDGYTVFALKNDGTVYAWGKNDCGQVGNTTTTDQKMPFKLMGLSNINKIIYCSGVAYAIKSDGTVYAWGYGFYGQIGNNDYTNQKVPLQIAGLAGISRIVTNGKTTFAITNDKTKLYGWGYNPSGQIGCYDGSTKYKPCLITALSNVQDVFIAGFTSYAIKTDGTLYGWGQNMYGQLANGGYSDRNYPQPIAGVPAVQQLLTNGLSTCVLGTDNSVYAWGYNAGGEVGNGNTSTRTTPFKVSKLNNISKISGNGGSLFAFDNTGVTYAWGQNTAGQLGLDLSGNQSTPVAITGLNSIDLGDIYLAYTTAFVLSEHGKKLYGWGNNTFGQLGTGNTKSVLSPALLLEANIRTITGAGEVDSIIPVTGTIDALTISITHPIVVAYTINPDSENGFVAQDIRITNNSRVAVGVTIQSFKSTPGGTLQFTDVSPDRIDWDNLNLAESKMYIALGLRYKDENEWINAKPEFANPFYAVKINNTLLGTLGKNSSASIMLSARHGLSFDRLYTAKHSSILVFSLIC
jgi:alpha-tubulin suppressor-like RCC1 family protein